MKKFLKKYWPYALVVLSYVPILLFIFPSYVKNDFQISLYSFFAFGMCMFYSFNILKKSLFEESEMKKSLKIIWGILITISFIASHLIAIIFIIFAYTKIDSGLLIAWLLAFIVAGSLFISGPIKVIRFLEDQNFIDKI